MPNIAGKINIFFSSWKWWARFCRQGFLSTRGPPLVGKPSFAYICVKHEYIDFWNLTQFSTTLLSIRVYMVHPSLHFAIYTDNDLIEFTTPSRRSASLTRPHSIVSSATRRSRGAINEFSIPTEISEFDIHLNLANNSLLRPNDSSDRLQTR